MLVPGDQELGKLVEILVLPALAVDVDDRQPSLPDQREVRLPELRRDPANLAEARGVEPAAVAEHLADRLVLPRRHLLEHVELGDHVLEREHAAPQEPLGRGQIASLDERRRLFGFRPGELQPELRSLMDGLEEQLVPVRLLLGPLLQREQFIGAQIPLVVARGIALENGRAEVLRLVTLHARSILLDVSDLFADAAAERIRDLAPLALRLRPRTLDEFVGQGQVLGEGSALRLAIAEDRVGSMILFGPPGTGKTTLARIVAETTGAAFEELSAVSATVSDVREVLARSRDRLGGSGTRTILFLDEIHRFNKAQQDALLPGVEEGLVTLIGATTENPYFSVNSALLSRCQVYELVALSPDELARIVRRGAGVLDMEIDDELVELVAARAGGDARNALNILELAARTARAAGSALRPEHVEDAARKRPLVYDKGGDAHYDFTSAFIKSMRGSDPDAAVYYLAAMLEGGEDARFIARRMVVLASEDIGNADPRALLVAVAAAQAVEHVGLPEARLNLAQAAIYLARAPKSNASYVALKEATADVQEHGHARPPDALRGTGYRGARQLGRGEGYIYPHDDPRGFEAEHLPEALRGRTYYRPSGSGEEEADDGD